ncbi:MAG: protein kinase [Lachnospiraceae bacterium]|nr:protein kinase [Lachnospiraceae bacterium]
MNYYENIVVFDKYKLVHPIGDNPFYSDYLGKDIETGNNVYVKMINPEKFTRYEVDKICFANECTQIRNFENPNLLKLYAVGSYSNTMCIVSEYVEGFKLLREYFSENSMFNIRTALEIIQRVALGLSYAHSRNVFHRGIRSSNIGIVENENHEIKTVKLFDFGVSQIIDYASTSSNFVDENFVFMAPETTGLLDHKVDARSDLYSLGILLYRFLTGHYPFHADTIDSMVYQHVAVMPKDPSEFNPTVTPAISKMTMRLLAKDPEQRYQSANELINDIDVYFNSSDPNYDSDEDALIQTMERRSKAVSRKSELAQLRNLYTQALKGEGHFCLVRGPLGCGKSDLFSNLCSELKESSIPYFRARFSSQGSGNPYHAFRDILIQYLNIYKSYEHKMASTERTRLFDALCGQSDLVFRFCPEMTSVLPKSEDTTELDEFRDSQRTADRLSAFFLQLYEQGKPFVIILDDIHNSDAASLTLLREMIQSIRNYKVFLVCSLRDGYDKNNELLSLLVENAEIGNSYSTTITLDDFDLDRMTEFVSDLLMINKADCQSIASYLIDKTGGNSYFACNLLRSMLEDGVITVSGGEIEENIDQFHMIDTDVNIFQVIETRLSKLSPEAIHMLEVASVIGSDFSVRLLLAVLDKPKEEVSPLISEAVDRQLIEYSSSLDILCFSHRDIQSVVNSHLSDEQKRELHLRIAKGLELIYPEIDRIIFELVYHYIKAGSESDIRQYILQAATKAYATGAHEDAIKYYDKALELFPYESNKDIWLSSKKAMVELNLISGHYDNAIEAARDLLPLMTDSTIKAQLLHRIALGFYRQSKFSECESYLINALKELGIHFPENGKRYGLSQNLLSLKSYLSIRMSKDLTKIEPRQVNDPSAALVVSIYETLCWTYAYSNIRRFIFTALKLFAYAKKTFGSSVQLALAASVISIYYMLQGDVKNVQVMQGAASKLRKDLGDKYGQARSLLFNGFTAQTTSELEKSIKLFKEASDNFKSIGDLWEYNNVLVFMLYSLLMYGSYEECVKTGQESISISERLGDGFSKAKVLAILVECYTQMGNFPLAESKAKECKEVVEALNFPYATACYDLAYGKLLYELGKYREALAIFKEAKKLIEDNSLSPVYLAPIYPYLALAMVKDLESTMNSMSASNVQTEMNNIRIICETAESLCAHTLNSRVTVKRAWGAYAILSNRLVIAEKEFPAGT